MEVRLDRLLGRPVIGLNGRRIGRLEEIRTHCHGEVWTIVEYEIGAAGLWERLGLGARRLVGLGGRGLRARWDQLIVDDERSLRLTCPVDELKRF